MSRTNGVLGLLDRNKQLDLIAYGLIGAFMLLTMLLGYMVLNSVSPPEGWLLDEQSVQLTGLLLAGMMVVYLLDQHRRLRHALADSHHRLEDSKNAAEAACRRLTTAHRAAEIMALVSDDGQLEQVADNIRHDLLVDGVGIVGESLVLSTDDDAARDEVSYAIERLAADTVRQGQTMRLDVEADSRYLAGIPLRVLGQLRGVLCVWHSSPLPDSEIAGLKLTARVIELGWESRILFQGVNQQLGRLVSVVSSLVEVRVPGYAAGSERIAQLSQQVGSDLGMHADEVRELGVAVRLRDLGVLNEFPSDSFFGVASDRRATAEHPVFGAQLAEKVGLSQAVQSAILHHHEDFAGTGYPYRARGTAIPLAARIIRACEAYVNLTGLPDDPENERARDMLVRGSGTSFDPAVVKAIVGEPEPTVVPSLTASPAHGHARSAVVAP